MKQPLDRADKASAGNSTCRVIALGSPHGDDRAAWLVADRLAEFDAHEVDVFKVSSPYEIVNHIDPDIDLVVLDICSSGASPGTVLRLDESNLDRFSSSVQSSHGGSLFESVRLAGALGRRPRSFCVLAVEMIEGDEAPEKMDVSHHCLEPLWTRLLVELSRRERRHNRLRTERIG